MLGASLWWPLLDWTPDLDILVTVGTHFRCPNKKTKGYYVSVTSQTPARYPQVPLPRLGDARGWSYDGHMSPRSQVGILLGEILICSRFQSILPKSMSPCLSILPWDPSNCFYESDPATWRVVWGQNIGQRTTEKAELFSNERCRRHEGKRRDASRMWD